MLDLSGTLSSLFNSIIGWITSFFSFLDTIYIFPHVSLLVFLVAISILSMILSAIFVTFNVGDDD